MNFSVRRSMWRRRLRTVLAAGGLFAGGMAWGQDLGERQAFSLEDLAERTEIRRNQFARMTPGEEPCLQEVGWQWFEDADFEPAFLERLVGVRELGLWTWPLRAELDPVSLETVFLNADGAEAGRERTDFAKAESARMSLRVPLVAEEDAQDFAYREERVADAERETAAGETPRLGGGATTNLAFTSIVATNGLVVVSLTNATGTVELFEYTMVHVPCIVTNVWTNDENFVVTNVATVWSNTSPSLCGFTNGWRILGRAGADPDTRTVRFTDWSVAPPDKIRFYAAAPLADTDGDGLSDGFETFCSHSGPANAHSLFPRTRDNLATNPATGRTWRDEALSVDATVTLTSSKPEWQMGESIGRDGTVTQTFENVRGQAIWLRVAEGGYSPEAFSVEVTGAVVAWTNETPTNGFTLLDMVLVPTPTNACTVVVHDSGIVYTNIWRPESLGADITLSATVFSPRLDNGDAFYDLNNDVHGYGFISGDPAMPEMFACLSSPLVPIPEVKWRCAISYTRPNRSDFDEYPTNGWHVCGPADDWNIVAAMGDDLRGGRMELRTQLGTAVLTNVFHIRGLNPDDADVEDLLAADSFRFALAIVQQECGYTPQRGYRQFNTTGTLGTNIQGVVTNDYKWCPNRSSDGIGWGLMQLTNPSPTAQQLWDWRANVQGGLNILNDKQAMASNYFAAVQRMYPAQYEPPPATYTPPGTSTALTALEAATIQNYNSGACFLEEIVSPSQTNQYRSCWAFNPAAPSGSRWTFVPNANDYVRKVVMRYENSQ